MQSDHTHPTRDAAPADLEPLARLWAAIWQTSHAHLLPPALVRLRTPETFRDRIAAALADVRVAGPVGAPLGFVLSRGDELNQLYVAAEAQGTGVAAALIDDAERRFAARGVRVAWLACAIGNDRAARYYEKRGWRRTGTFIHHADTAEGPVPIEAWRYEKEIEA